MSKYLQKRTLFLPQIKHAIAANLGIVVVIPCYNEPDLLASLKALYNCNLPNCSVEVIVLINGSDADSPAVQAQNATTLNIANAWIMHHQQKKLRFYTLYHPQLAARKAGVGTARKIGMDEAAYRLMAVNNPNGIIACFDADSSCQTNYLCALEQHFLQYPKTSACSIHFEHPIQGSNYVPSVYESIVQYELHLRYYVNAQRFAEFPHAYHTIGSSMAVRCIDYQKQGGMNRRKAGEDFYFLHKFIPLGNFTELHNTTLIPSPRSSDRVPFGTGKAVGLLQQQTTCSYATYNLQTFIDLKQFFAQVNDLYYLHNTTQLQAFVQLLAPSVRLFLASQVFHERWQEIKKHTKTLASFKQRFFRWFNAFVLMKYVHFARDNFYPNVDVTIAATQLHQKLSSQALENNDAQCLLNWYRRVDNKQLTVIFTTK